MNIVTPIPTTVVFTTANVNTEAARRENVQRETIPQTGGLENSAAESGLGSESDRVKTAGQPPQPVVYERPQTGQAQNPSGQGELFDQDNGEDPSAGRENAEARQQEQQQQAEQQEIDELQRRDREVRTHENAHAAVGGQYAGSPNYEFESGPDGRQYAVGGEVSIDISEGNTPEETVRKMQQVRAAALAPAEPSPADLRVAGEATQLAAEARVEIANERAEEAEAQFSEVFPESNANAISSQQVEGNRQSGTDTSTSNDSNDRNGAPELDDIVKEIGTGSDSRTLSEDPIAEAVGLETNAEEFRQRLANREVSVLRAVGVIENFYQNVSEPRSAGLQRTA